MRSLLKEDEKKVADFVACGLRAERLAVDVAYDGPTITKRHADPGSLIQAGTSSSTQTLRLVRLPTNDRLRMGENELVMIGGRTQVRPGQVVSPN